MFPFQTYKPNDWFGFFMWTCSNCHHTSAFFFSSFVLFCSQMSTFIFYNSCTFCLKLCAVLAVIRNLNTSLVETTALQWLVLQVAADPFDESEEELRPHISWRERWPLFLACLRGQSGIPCRSANLLHVLGSVTVRISSFQPVLYLKAQLAGSVLRW